jgi:predicted NBD/HSP70 family sugar kinase
MCYISDLKCAGTRPGGLCYTGTMYVGIDVGGTKTLVAVLDDTGVIVERHKLPTAKQYDEQLAGFKAALTSFEHQEFKAGGIGVPGRIDRERGISLGSPNVAWGNEPLQADGEKIFGCPFVIENDANLAALSEAMLHKDYATVLYFTISTGIGTGVVRDQKLDPAFLNIEGGHIVLPYKNKLMDWEDFASGRAIYQHFGKRAADITDAAAWQTIARNLSLGFFENIAIVQPDLIVIGGSIGTYFDRYGDYLAAELKKYELPIVPIPKIVGAQRPEEAVIYGCYDLAKQRFSHG